MRDPAYAAFSALDPFFDIVSQGLAGLVDGDHYFDTIAPDAVFEFRYRFPGWPTKLVGREALMALYAGYGEGMALHGASGVNALVRDLRDEDIRTKIRLRATGATHGGIPFERGSLFYLLRNRFYIGEVKYKGEILPGEQPAIMDRELFDAVQQRLTDQWSHRNHAKTKSDHLLTGLLFDDAGHRMIPTHATKAGIRYRYYVSLPHLKGESKTVPVGSVSRIPATNIEDIIVKFVNEHLVAQHDQPTSSSAHADDRGVRIAEHVVRIDVHKDRLIVSLKSAGTEEDSHPTDGQLLSIRWQKPPSRKSRQILIPLGVPRNGVRPTRIERRARLVNAIARGRRWLDEIVSGSATSVEQIATRQKCSVRQVNMTISLAFLAPGLVKAAVEGRLPRGIGVERLRDAPAEWSRQFEALGLNPQ
jgi:site-specific DNA recombinase